MGLVHEKQGAQSAPQGPKPSTEAPRSHPLKAVLRGATYEEGVPMLAPPGAVVQRHESGHSHKHESQVSVVEDVPEGEEAAYSRGPSFVAGG